MEKMAACSRKTEVKYNLELLIQAGKVTDRDNEPRGTLRGLSDLTGGPIIGVCRPSNESR